MKSGENNVVTNWSIDKDHSELNIKIKHLMFAHINSKFKTFDINIFSANEYYATVKFNLIIDASSIYTGHAKSDEYFKSSHFLDVENHRQIIFNSISVGKPDSSGNQELLGELTIKGITKKIKINFLFERFYRGNKREEKAALIVSAKINLNDWGLVFKTPIEARGYRLSDEVTIFCEAELINSVQKHQTIILEPAKSNIE